MNDVHREILLCWTCILAAVGFWAGLRLHIRKSRHGGLIALTSLVLGGTSMLIVLFWGAQSPLCGGQWDSQFVLASILRVKSGHFFSDMYYPELPPYYPPLYAWVLGGLALLAEADPATMTVLGAILTPSIAAVPLFLVLRKREGDLVALLTTGSFLLLFALGSNELFSKPYESMSIPLFLAWLFIFLESKDRSFKAILLGGGGA